MKPCHTFSGVVEQWKTSRHYAAYVSNLGGEEVASWTGAKSCGNCHASDGIEQRLAGNVTHAGTDGPGDLEHGQLSYLDSGSSSIKEISYAGQTTVAVVGCGTCHDNSAENDNHVTGADYEAGRFPLRVPTGTDDYAIIEKSSEPGASDGTASANYGNGNACMWCHKSRKDVTNYIPVAGIKVTSTTWGPHHGPQADVYTGVGGYHYANKTYDNGTHAISLKNGCVDCHMPAIADNMQIGNHSFYPQLSACTGCHKTAKDFDVSGGQTDMKTKLRALRTALNDLSLLSREGVGPLTDDQLADDEFAADEALPQPSADDPLTADVAGALYNYFILARGSGTGVHNPNYSKQLVYDSIEAVDGDLTGITRP